MHNRIHDSIIDLVLQCTCAGPGTAHRPCVLNFFGQKSVRGGSTVVCAQDVANDYAIEFRDIVSPPFLVPVSFSIHVFLGSSFVCPSIVMSSARTISNFLDSEVMCRIGI